MKQGIIALNSEGLRVLAVIDLTIQRTSERAKWKAFKWRKTRMRI